MTQVTDPGGLHADIHGSMRFDGENYKSRLSPGQEHGVLWYQSNTGPSTL